MPTCPESSESSRARPSSGPYTGAKPEASGWGSRTSKEAFFTETLGRASPRSVRAPGLAAWREGTTVPWDPGTQAPLAARARTSRAPPGPQPQSPGHQMRVKAPLRGLRALRSAAQGERADGWRPPLSSLEREREREQASAGVSNQTPAPRPDAPGQAKSK